MRALLLPATAVSLALAGCTDYGLTAQPPPEAPVVVLEPEAPITADDLFAVVQQPDPRVRYDYAWFRDGLAAPEYETDVVPSVATRKGELWQVVVTPYLGELAGGEGRAQVEIGNTPPSVELAWEDDAPSTLDGLVLLPTPADPDEDPVTLTFVWTVDGAQTDHTGDRVPFDDTARGQVWTVTVTPNDGEADGLPATATLEVRNLPPALDAVVIEPDPAFTDTTLVARTVGLDDLDGDDITLNFDWYVDGTLAQSGAEDTLGPDLFVKHQAVHVEVTPTDGTDDGDPVTSDTITIRNTPPILGSATITPTPIRTRTDATCVPADYADVDGDPATYAYEWTVNGRVGGRSATLGWASQKRGDVLVCTITPNDGEEDGAPVASAPVTVVNTPSVITGATLSPSSPKVADTITVAVTGTSDDDGDTVTFRYAWTVNSAAISHTGASLSSAFFKKGDRVAVTVTPNDGYEDGTPITSASVTVANTAPTVSALTLAPRPAYTTTSLTATPTAADADGDTLAYVYAWYVDGAKQSATGSVLGSSYFVKGDVVYAEVTATDGADSSAALASAALTISNSAPSTPTTPGLTPTAPTPTDDLVCALGSASTDPDGDALSYEFEFWRGGSRYGSYTTSALTYTLASSATADGDTCYCGVGALDGDGGI